MKKLLCTLIVLAALFQMPAFAVPGPLEEDEFSDQAFAEVKALLRESEAVFRGACEQMLEDDIEVVSDFYEQETWVIKDKEQLPTETETYMRVMELDVQRLSLYGEVVDIRFGQYSVYYDFLKPRVYGLYYLPCDSCEDLTPEQRLEKHMDGEQWEYL